MTLDLCKPITPQPRVPGCFYVARRLVIALRMHGFPVVPGDNDEPAAIDDFACGLMITAGIAGRVLADHPGARVRSVDIFRHVDYGPDRVGYIVELDTHHLFGGSLPVLHGDLLGRATIPPLLDAPVFRLKEKKRPSGD